MKVAIKNINKEEHTSTTLKPDIYSHVKIEGETSLFSSTSSTDVPALFPSSSSSSSSFYSAHSSSLKISKDSIINTLALSPADFEYIRRLCKASDNIDWVEEEAIKYLEIAKIFNIRICKYKDMLARDPMDMALKHKVEFNYNALGNYILKLAEVLSYKNFSPIEIYKYAIFSFKIAKLLNPTDIISTKNLINAYSGLAHEFIVKNNYYEAINLYEKILDLDPNDTANHLKLANTHKDFAEKLLKEQTAESNEECIEHFLEAYVIFSNISDEANAHACLNALYINKFVEIYIVHNNMSEELEKHKSISTGAYIHEENVPDLEAEVIGQTSE